MSSRRTYTMNSKTYLTCTTENMEQDSKEPKELPKLTCSMDMDAGQNDCVQSNLQRNHMFCTSYRYVTSTSKDLHSQAHSTK